MSGNFYFNKIQFLYEGIEVVAHTIMCHRDSLVSIFCHIFTSYLSFHKGNSRNTHYLDIP